MDDLKKEIAGEIKNFILTGFYENDETVDRIKDMFYNETIDEAWVKDVVEREYTKRLSEQSSWATVTDFDKLVKVFDQLNSSGIIALHKAGNTRQDGEEDTFDLHQELEKKGVKTKGYCFYHSQDVDRAIDVRSLFLAFGDFEGNDKLTLEIGNKIVETLHQQGFKTKWDNTIETRIEIIDFSWQKGFGNENCSYEHSAKLLSMQ